MTEIVDGELRYNEVTMNANGGTELMARRIVKHVPQEALKGFQIIHSRVRELIPGLKKILVLHDLPQDPEAVKLQDPEYRKQFDKLVFVSNWQMQMFNLVLGVPYSDSIVIPNGIEPFKYKDRVYGNNQINLIYHTTPHRGLRLLVPVYEELQKHFNVHLDVYSSFKAYGWDHRDNEYKETFDQLRKNPGVTYHGYRPNAVIRDALQDAHIFAYPNIWPETSCLAAIEALAAGTFVVHPNYAALPETCEHGSFMYNFQESPQKHVDEFYRMLYAVVKLCTEQPDRALNVSRMISGHYGAVYNFAETARLWVEMLGRVKNEKSSQDS